MTMTPEERRVKTIETPLNSVDIELELWDNGGDPFWAYVQSFVLPEEAHSYFERRATIVQKMCVAYKLLEDGFDFYCVKYSSNEVLWTKHLHNDS